MNHSHHCKKGCHAQKYIRTWSTLWGCIILAFAGALRAADSSTPTFVRGFSGEAKGGFREKGTCHHGEVPFAEVRKQKGLCEMQWKTAAVPAGLPAATVTFVWTGGLGGAPLQGDLGDQRPEVVLASMGPCHQGDFTISVNGHAAADFDVVMEPTEFPGRQPECRLVFNVVYTPDAGGFSPYPQHASGYFYLSVPKAWVKPGEAASIEVRAKVKDSEAESSAWFALIASDDAPLSPPDQVCKVFRPIEESPRFRPPPKGEEASIQWYRKQFDGDGILTAIGPPGDAADLGVSASGQLMYNFDRLLPGTPYAANALVFGIVENGRAVPFGWEPAARQELVDGTLPCVVSKWRSDDWEMEQTAFGRPLRGKAVVTGLESTVGWADFRVRNCATTAREFTLLVTRMGDRGKIRRDLSYRQGVVMENGSARFSAKTPHGFSAEFLPMFPADAKPDAARPEMLLRRGGLYDVLAIRGTIPAGETRTLVVNGVFDFPGMDNWKAEPVKVAPEELLSRSAEKDREEAIADWRALARGVTHLSTPDDVFNRLCVKSMLDGYNLTKRWDKKWICIDSVCYRRQWDDTSAKWFYALDLLGDHATAERLLDTVFARQGQRKPAGTRTHEGCFSDVTNTVRDGSASAWASCNGWALWSMAEHARLANDKKWWQSHRKQILDGARWIVRERAFSKEKPNNPCAGLLYGKFVCDMPDGWGPGGVGYFTYTDAISYMGLHETALLLKEWGDPEGEKLLAEANVYRKDIIAAVDRLTDKSTDPWFTPWALHAPKLDVPYFNGACGPINLAYARVLPPNDQRIDHVIRWNVDCTNRRSPERSAVAAMFYTQDLAIALLELGREEEFLRMFYTILASNVSPDTLTTFEWASNTQPHLHSVSSLIRMARTMLVQERDGELALLQGTPRRWHQHGKVIRISDAPTYWGPLSLTSVSDIHNRRIRLHLALPARIGDTPVRIKLRLPDHARIAGVTIDGREYRQYEGEWITLGGLRGEVEVVVKTE
jgi:hypothetical protein